MSPQNNGNSNPSAAQIAPGSVVVIQRPPHWEKGDLAEGDLTRGEFYSALGKIKKEPENTSG
jgi:hypothetical protein